MKRESKIITAVCQPMESAVPKAGTSAKTLVLEFCIGT